MTQYLVKTDEAHIVKSTIEILQNNFTDVCFEFADNHIGLITTDNKEPYTKLAVLDWPKDNFDEFKCAKPSNVGINLQHFYKLLKTIKKKDRISIELSKTRPGKLIINKISNGYKPSESELQIQRRQLIHVDLFDGYEDSVLTTTAIFQRACKEINQLSKTITVTNKNSFLNFSCDIDGMYRHNVPFGDHEQDTENNENVESEEGEEYEDVFYTKTLMGIATKISSLNDKMTISTCTGRSLKIEVKTGNLGTLTFYIRSKSQLDP